MNSMPVSAWLLVCANLVPIFFVFFGEWKLGEILFLYWLESGIIGALNVLRILFARGFAPASLNSPAKVPPPAMLALLSWAGKVFMAAFFTLHFGGFMAVHGVFLFAIINGKFSDSPGFDIVPMLEATRWAAAALALSHTASFIINYVFGSERERSSASEFMARPYPRIIVMHMTIILGTFAAIFMGTSMAYLALLVALKLGMDLRSHLAERKRLGTAKGS